MNGDSWDKGGIERDQTLGLEARAEMLRFFALVRVTLGVGLG